MRLVTANVTALNTTLDVALALVGDVLALQEVRLAEMDQAKLNDTLKDRGWKALWGKPQPLLTQALFQVRPAPLVQGGARAGGVAVLVKADSPAQLMPRSTDR